MKKTILFFAAIMTAAASFAQDGQIYKALEQRDEGKFHEAQATMKEVLANPKTKKLAFAYNVAGQVELRLLNGEVDKIQQGLAIDTTLFINCMDKAVEYFTKSYELDHTPDAKGKVKPKYDWGDKFDIGEGNGNRVWMKKIINYYLYSAQYRLIQGNEKDAYKYYIKYLEFPDNPVFTKAEADSIRKADKKNISKVGYYASMIAFRSLKDYDLALKTVDMAIDSEDAVTREDCYFMKAYSQLQKQDTAQWLNTLKLAMENTNNVSYPQMMLKYYYDHHQQAEASKIADEFVAKAPDNKMAHYIKGVVLMDQMKDKEALECFNKALEIDPNFVEAIANVGVVHFNEIRELNQKATTDNKDPKYKAQQNELKEKLTVTRQYFAKVQELVPDNPALWQEKLQNIDNLIDVVENNLKEVAKRDKK